MHPLALSVKLNLISANRVRSMAPTPSNATSGTSTMPSGVTVEKASPSIIG